MNKLLSIILRSPVIISLLVFDIIKLPLALGIVMPLTFLFSLSDMLRGDVNWLNRWIKFNLEFGCFTYMMRNILFD
jgi:hypothetical protein